tara:strand:- start:6350 stop:7276 length:927 start_codon:yes stop_codon:yes gene_type:complete
MLDKIKKMMSKKEETQEAEDLKVLDEQVNAQKESEPATDAVPETYEGDEYISDEEWEAMTPEQRAEYEDDEDDEDYLSDEEWDAMSPEERQAWEEGANEDAVPENVEDDNDPDYILSSPEVVGFDSFDQQMEMYDSACEEIEVEESVLDFGCGRGDLYDFLYRRDGMEPKYKGVDINEPLIKAGLKKYEPNIQLECKDWNALEPNETADWCVNIGSLCTRYDGSSKKDIEVVKETIDKMMLHCTVGCSLVLFSSYMPEEVREEEFLITDPKEIFDYAITKYGGDNGNVALDHSQSDSAYKLVILKTQY